MKARFALLVLLLLCTGCWDIKEINQLAIVNLGGVDKNPETDELTAYYQVINPSGLSARQGGAAKAAVYTFNFKDYSMGKISVKTNTLMPRLLFMPHMQSIIVSERYAKQGILDLLNYYEMSPERRTTTILLVTDSPLATILNSYTPLDRVPGRYIRSVAAMVGKGYTSGREPVRLSDMIKKINRRSTILIPIVHYTANKPAHNTSRLEEADVNKQSIEFVGGAVFIEARMVGRVDIPTKITYSILNGMLKTYVETIRIDGDEIDVEACNMEVRRIWGPSGLTIKVHSELRLVSNQQKVNLSETNMREIEQAFNQILSKKSKALLQLARRNDWDMFGLQDEGIKDNEWRKYDVQFQISSDAKRIGNTSGPYILKKE